MKTYLDNLTIKGDVIGDKERFAIEYCLTNLPLPFGHVRVWIAGLWIGDFSYSAFLAYFCRKLFYLQSKRIGQTSLMFPVAPSLDEEVGLRQLGNWSFGEAFDGFGLFYYGVIADRTIHVHWQLSEELKELFPDYPKGPQRKTIPFELFDEVTTPFLARIFESTVGWEGFATA